MPVSHRTDESPKVPSNLIKPLHHSAQLHRSCQPSSWWPASQHSASVTYQCDAFDFKPSPESVALRFPGSPLDEDIAQSSRVSSLVGEVVVFRSIRNAAKPKECDINFFVLQCCLSLSLSLSLPWSSSLSLCWLRLWLSARLSIIDITIL